MIVSIHECPLGGGILLVISSGAACLYNTYFSLLQRGGESAIKNVVVLTCLKTESSSNHLFSVYLMS